MDASTTLPGPIAALFTTVDEADTVSTPDGEVTYARIGTVQILVAARLGQLRWHEHDNEDDARECYARNLDNARQFAAFVSNGGDPRVFALAQATGMPVEVAQQIIGSGLVQVEVEEAPQVEQPVRAIGRAPVPTGTVYQAASEPHTGMYL
jgi:hypothetical protein